MVALFAPFILATNHAKLAPLDPSFVTVEVQDPSLKAWGAEAKALMVKWYPKIEDLLGVPQEEHPQTVYLVIDTHGDGIAGTANRRIEVNGDYVRKNPKDIGLIVHELTHVVQSYSRGDTPGWLVEGIADYVRWFNYEPVSKRPHPKSSRVDYHHGYQDTAAFLNWAVQTYNPQLVRILNQSAYLGTYSGDVWSYGTRHSLDEVWQAYLSHLRQDEAASPNR